VLITHARLYDFRLWTKVECRKSKVEYGDDIMEDLKKETLTIEFIRWDRKFFNYISDFSRCIPNEFGECILKNAKLRIP
jgi:hypothetical protein